VTQKGRRGITLLILYLSTRWGWVVNAMPRPLFSRGKKKAPIPIVEEAVYAPGPIWTGMKKRKYFAPTGVRNANRPACSGSLYRLRYPGPFDPNNIN
jgi:hypothetical protein